MKTQSDSRFDNLFSEERHQQKASHFLADVSGTSSGFLLLRLALVQFLTYGMAIALCFAQSFGA